MHPDVIPVPLRDRAGATIAFAVVDACDAHLAEHRWYLSADGRGNRRAYASRTIKEGDRWVRLHLHREVLGAAPLPGFVVDHINGLTLDCRRANLRVVTIAENAQNQGPRSHAGKKASRYRGVTWNKVKRKWQAFAHLGGRYKLIGYFTDEDEAGAAASAWRAEHMPFSEDARSCS